MHLVLVQSVMDIWKSTRCSLQQLLGCICATTPRPCCCRAPYHFIPLKVQRQYIGLAKKLDSATVSKQYTLTFVGSWIAPSFQTLAVTTYQGCAGFSTDLCDFVGILWHLEAAFSKISAFIYRFQCCVQIISLT